MNSKQQKILAKVLTRPVLSNIKFIDVDKMLVAMGYEKEQREGSRVAYGISTEEFVMHKPHPGDEIKKYVIVKLQKFIQATKEHL